MKVYEFRRRVSEPTSDYEPERSHFELALYFPGKGALNLARFTSETESFGDAEIDIQAYDDALKGKNTNFLDHPYLEHTGKIFEIPNGLAKKLIKSWKMLNKSQINFKKETEKLKNFYH